MEAPCSDKRDDSSSTVVPEDLIKETLLDAIRCTQKDQDLAASPEGEAVAFICSVFLAGNDAFVELAGIMCKHVPDIFQDGVATTSQREILINKFHTLRINEEFLAKAEGVVGRHAGMSASQTPVQYFMQVTLSELQRLILLQMRRHTEQILGDAEANLCSETKSVLFYVSGFLLHRTLCQAKNGGEKEQIEQFVCTEESSENVSTKRWTIDRNRGGLKIPTENFFAMVCRFEEIVCKHVDIHHLHSKSLDSVKLKETLMSDDAVILCWEKN